MPQLLLPGVSFTSTSQRAPASHQFTNPIDTDVNELPLSSSTTKMPWTRNSVWPKAVEQDHPGVTLRKCLVSVLGPYLLICGLGLLVTNSDWGLSILYLTCASSDLQKHMAKGLMETCFSPMKGQVLHWHPEFYKTKSPPLPLHPYLQAVTYSSCQQIILPSSKMLPMGIFLTLLPHSIKYQI